MGVLGSGENGVKKLREQGAWGQKDQNNLGSREPREYAKLIWGAVITKTW